MVKGSIYIKQLRGTSFWPRPGSLLFSTCSQHTVQRKSAKGYKEEKHCQKTRRRQEGRASLPLPPPTHTPKSPSQVHLSFQWRQSINTHRAFARLSGTHNSPAGVMQRHNINWHQIPRSQRRLPSYRQFFKERRSWENWQSVSLRTFEFHCKVWPRKAPEFFTE